MFVYGVLSSETFYKGEESMEFKTKIMDTEAGMAIGTLKNNPEAGKAYFLVTDYSSFARTVGASHIVLIVGWSMFHLLRLQMRNLLLKGARIVIVAPDKSKVAAFLKREGMCSDNLSVWPASASFSAELFFEKKGIKSRNIFGLDYFKKDSVLRNLPRGSSMIFFVNNPRTAVESDVLFSGDIQYAFSSDSKVIKSYLKETALDCRKQAR